MKMKNFSKIAITYLIQSVSPDIDHHFISISVSICIEAIIYGWKSAKKNKTIAN